MMLSLWFTHHVPVILSLFSLLYLACIISKNYYFQSQGRVNPAPAVSIKLLFPCVCSGTIGRDRLPVIVYSYI